ncbi:snoRNA-binding protein [Coemansia sp. Benny D115]|nr:snoRNA-binding protein [Coemansia sp. Benny D115]
MGKSSKRDRSSSVTMEEVDTEVQLPPGLVAPIAHPMMDKKLTKKVLKVAKKAAKHRHIKRGVKEVVKALRKGEKGLVVMAGNISPIDVLSHIPVLCEDNSVPYVFLNTKEELGESCSTKRPTCCLMVVPGGKDGKGVAHEDYKDTYEECYSAAKELDEKLLVKAATGVVAA